MSWAIAIGLAVAGFALAVLAFRVQRAAWAMLAAALVFGLAGYAFQARPDLPAAPKSAQKADIGEAGWQMVELRKAFVSERYRSPSPALITADALVRQGQFENAATLLGGIVRGNPRDAEAWLALANALVEHADGNLTPAALNAYREATAAAPEEPGPAVFMGLALIRQGELIEAHQLWTRTLERAPADAAWRPLLAERLALLEELMRRIVEQSQQGQQP
jgi:cytochrome c-type biogenesis protein CcmH